jgi:DNA N-6-adenine-methyltransferase Dam
MAEHEPSIGMSDDWFTPREYFEALGLTFDLDVASPGPGHWVPARKIYTKADDGLAQPWHGFVFCNPPYGGRRGHVPWLVRFLDHGSGIGVFRAYTSADWFHEHIVPRAELLCFPKGKTKFIKPTGEVGKQPGHGTVLLGMGAVACEALRRSGLGFCATIERSATVMTGRAA